MAPEFVCPDCLGTVEDARSDACANCGFVRPADGWLVDPLTGLILGGRYRLEGRLGAGGMASVFRASRVGALGGEVAVKILAPRFSRTVVARRFEREAKVVSRLTSPHIVRIYDYETFTLPGSAQPLFYIAMELVKGTTLSAVLTKQGKVNFLWGIDILRQTARGLEEAHREGITHRDIKPSNMMLVQQRESTHVKLVDFGIAALADVEGDQASKLTQTGFVSGTPDYMAPEQAVGSADVGPPADIYALGVVAYEMFSGTRPFESESIMDTLMQRVTRPAPSLSEAVSFPEFPRELHRIVDKMLATNPAERFPHAGALLDVLARFPAMQTTPDWVPPIELLQRFATVQARPAVPAREAEAEAEADAGAQLAKTHVGAAPAKGAFAPTVSAFDGPAVAPPPRRARWPLVVGGVVLAGGLGVGAYLLAAQPSEPSPAPTAIATTTTTGAAPDAATPPGPADVRVEQGAPDTADVRVEQGAPDTAPAAAPPSDAAPPPDTATQAAPPLDAAASAEIAEPALPAALPVTLKHARPPLEPGMLARGVTRGDLRVSLGIPQTLPPLYQPLALRLTIDRAGAPLRLSEAAVRVAALPSGDIVGRARGRGRSQDGRVALELPPLPMAARYRLEIVATLPDQTTLTTDVVYDAATGAVTAE